MAFDLNSNSSASSSSSLCLPFTPPRSPSKPPSKQTLSLPAWVHRRIGLNNVQPNTDANPTPPSANRPMTSPDQFDFIDELGSGSYSTVFEAIHMSTSQRFAIKVLSKAQLVKEDKARFATVEKSALAILGTGGHPGIVRFYSAFQDPTSLYFVLSLATGDLRSLVKKTGSLSVPCARYYAAQIVDTVQWIHSKGVLHRDLKPENVLLDADMRVKITDFGSAYISTDLDLSPRPSTFVGSAAYVSPELVLRSSRSTSRSSDIWGIGCIIYFLFVGKPPFLALTDYLSMRKIETLDYSIPEFVDSDARDLIERILVLEPSDRIGVEPKSSPSELRNHHFFLESVSMPCMDWDTLWTSTPVPVERGFVAPAESQQTLWDQFVDFSVVEGSDS